MLSKRGRKNLGESNPLASAHFKAEENAWHPENNPSGLLNMGTAENGLLYDLLHEKLKTLPVVPESLTHYTNFEGSNDFRSEFARYYSMGLISTIDASQVVMSTGSSAILEQLAHLLLDPGDGVLLPSPYYAGFDHIFTARADLIPVPAYLSSADGYNLSIRVLEETFGRAMEDGIRIRALLITNPHNPLGVVYPPELIQELIGFARSNNLIVIVDEIYRNSIFEETDYTSALDLANGYEDHVHVVYGFAKDFALSGFKAGVLISRNRELLKAIPQLTYFSSLSTATQHILYSILSDNDWIMRFQQQNRVRLKHAYKTFTRLLDEKGIRYHSASAGFFLWIDLRIYLNRSNKDGEIMLYKKIFEKGGVNLSPGTSFHSLETGWFRACYAKDDDFLTEAVDRLYNVLNE